MEHYSEHSIFKLLCVSRGNDTLHTIVNSCITSLELSDFNIFFLTLRICNLNIMLLLLFSGGRGVLGQESVKVMLIIPMNILWSDQC